MPTVAASPAQVTPAAPQQASAPPPWPSVLAAAQADPNGSPARTRAALQAWTASTRAFLNSPAAADLKPSQKGQILDYARQQYDNIEPGVLANTVQGLKSLPGSAVGTAIGAADLIPGTFNKIVGDADQGGLVGSGKAGTALIGRGIAELGNVGSELNASIGPLLGDPDERIAANAINADIQDFTNAAKSGTLYHNGKPNNAYLDNWAKGLKQEAATLNQDNPKDYTTDWRDIHSPVNQALVAQYYATLDPDVLDTLKTRLTQSKAAEAAQRAQEAATAQLPVGTPEYIKNTFGSGLDPAQLAMLAIPGFGEAALPEWASKLGLAGKLANAAAKGAAVGGVLGAAQTLTGSNQVPSLGQIKKGAEMGAVQGAVLAPAGNLVGEVKSRLGETGTSPIKIPAKSAQRGRPTPAIETPNVPELGETPQKPQSEAVTTPPKTPVETPEAVEQPKTPIPLQTPVLTAAKGVETTIPATPEASIQTGKAATGGGKAGEVPETAPELPKTPPPQQQAADLLAKVTHEDIPVADIAAQPELDKVPVNAKATLQVQAALSRPPETVDIPVRGKSTVENFIHQGMVRAQAEEAGQYILDTLDERGETPKDVVQKFWEQTYDTLDDKAQKSFQRYIQRETGMEPGDILYTDKDGNPHRSTSWQDIFGTDQVPNDVHYLEGTERGLIALMAQANEVHAQNATPKTAPATYLGEQEGLGPLYNLTEDIPGHPKGSTLSGPTLEKLGYELPKPESTSTPKSESPPVASRAEIAKPTTEPIIPVGESPFNLASEKAQPPTPTPNAAEQPTNQGGQSNAITQGQEKPVSEHQGATQGAAIPANPSQVRAQNGQLSGRGGSIPRSGGEIDTRTPTDILLNEDKVKMTAPKGATTARVTFSDPNLKAKTYSLKDLNGDNILKGQKVAKIEPGVMGAEGFRPMKGKVGVEAGGTTKGLIRGSALEKYADSVIKQGRLAAGFDPEVFAAYAIKGAALIEQGIRDFPEWSRRMTAQFGDAVKEHLQGIYNASTRLNDTKSVAGLPVSPEAKLTANLDEVGSPSKSPSTFTPDEIPAKVANVLTGAKDKAGEIYDSLKQHARSIGRSISDLPRMTNFKKVLLAWDGANQVSSIRGEALVKAINRLVPDVRGREAISNWLDAGGDEAKLRQWADATKDSKLKAGYERALHLTPQEQTAAAQIRQYFREKFEQGKAAGVFREKLENGETWNGVEDYITHLVQRPYVGDHPLSPGGKLASTFKFGRERQFPNFFDLEQAGYKPATKDVSKILAIYGEEMNKVINTRKLVKALTQTKDESGNALAKPIGGVLTNDQGGESTLIRPLASARGEDINYRPLKVNNSALRGWTFVANDANGNPVLLKGEMGFHPDIAAHMDNVLGRSAIREWYNEPSGPVGKAIKGIIRGAEQANSTIKNTMMGLSGFHQVQEGVRALGHTVNPFTDVTPLNADDPKLQYAVNNGLKLSGDNAAMNAFIDGFGGQQNLLEKIPGVGKVIHAYANYLFGANGYIARLKWKAWQPVYDRNLSTYAAELKAGTVTKEDIALLTSRQINATFGRLNLADSGSNPTMRHIIQLVALAPDFEVANLRNYGHIAQGFYSKAGRQQLRSFALTAGVLWLTARAINGLVNNGNTHPEKPLSVLYDGREYSLRSVPGDIGRLISEPRQFLEGRESPIFGSAIDALQGVNWRGERQTASQALGDLAAKIIPINARQLPGVKDLTATTRDSPISAFQSLLNSLGVNVKRSSPIADTYSLANAYNRAHGVLADTGIYPVSRYQPLLYSLEDGNIRAAAEAIQQLKKADPKLTDDKLIDGFRTSLFHPYTGNDKTTDAFAASLKGEDAKTYQAAQAQRQQVWQRFRDILSGQNSANVTSFAVIDDQKARANESTTLHTIADSILHNAAPATIRQEFLDGMKDGSIASANGQPSPAFIQKLKTTYTELQRTQNQTAQVEQLRKLGASGTDDARAREIYRIVHQDLKTDDERLAFIQLLQQNKLITPIVAKQYLALNTSRPSAASAR